MLKPLQNNLLVKQVKKDEELKGKTGIVVSSKPDIATVTFKKFEIIDMSEEAEEMGFEKGQVVYVSKNGERPIGTDLYLVQTHNVHAIEVNEEDAK